ncbi:MAG: hypothetical protein LJE83_15385 [Gammaproteobacteria bacterium]|nr:hypothetical protein [Gammaproteobacteria bacterium]
MLQVKAKRLIIAAVAAMALLSMAVQAGEMKPFILASITSGNLKDQSDNVKKALSNAGFEIVGEYSPYTTAHIIIVTNKDLLKMAAAQEHGGYAAVARVSITKVGEQLQLAYTNPAYMAAAYHVDGDVDAVYKALKTALGFIREYGSEDGLDEDDLKDYHYTLGMERFDDYYKLAVYNSHKEAVAAVEKNLAAHAGGASKVYRIDIPGDKQTLFGVALSSKTTGNKYMDDKFIMTEIDFKNPRSTAHLPYEILVTGKNVEALHARFRIAINFPDLSMMGANSFMNIMPSPDAIRKSLTLVAGGKLGQDF